MNSYFFHSFFDFMYRLLHFVNTTIVSSGNTQPPYETKEKSNTYPPLSYPTGCTAGGIFAVKENALALSLFVCYNCYITGRCFGAGRFLLYQIYCTMSMCISSCFLCRSETSYNYERACRFYKLFEMGVFMQLFDFHMHTCFSGDCDTPAEEMIESAIQKGLSSICITDHNDPDFPPSENCFDLDTPAYLTALTALQERYKEQIDVRIGVELGLQPHLAGFFREYLSSYPFDFVIGSSHLVDGQDPYYPVFFEGREEAASYERYFTSIIENLNAFSDIDVYGHIDYIVRYGPNKNARYSYRAYEEVLETILRTLIEKGVGLEVNTGGYRYGLGVPNPMPAIIRRYLALGGECITLGADAHTPSYVAFSFDKALELLRDCGVRYLCTFRQRIPEYHKL